VALWAFLEFFISPNATFMTPLASVISESTQLLPTHRKNLPGMWYSYQCFNLPQQPLWFIMSIIRVIGAPNGLCSSIITESKHYQTVKEPWQCSIASMLLDRCYLQINGFDKLAAAHVNSLTVDASRNTPQLIIETCMYISI